MKPAPFSYLVPDNVAQVVKWLAEFGDDAKIIAGGQSLVPVLNFRLSRWKYLIDIGRLEELLHLRLDGNELCIGAATTYRRIETSDLVRQHAPLLVRGIKFVAHLPIRTRGTIGGSVSNFDPASECPALLLALDATLVVRGTSGKRTIKAQDFFLDLFTTALEPSEIVIEIRVPVARADHTFGFQEFSRRPGDLALAGVAVAARKNGGVVSEPRVAVFGFTAGAQRVAAAEEVLADQIVTLERIDQSARHVRELPAQTDLHATAEMRSHLASVLTSRALREALLGDEREAS